MRRDGESGRSSGRFCDIRAVEATDSTNADVAALARAGAPEGVVIVADHQRAGRGRRGRTWISPPGTALLASVLVRPRLAPSVAPLVGLAAGVAAVEACHDVAGVAPSLKWPNDVVVESPTGIGIGTATATTAELAKLAGLLAESLVEGGELRAVVIGMGCNLRRAIVDDWCRSAGCIEIHSAGGGPPRKPRSRACSAARSTIPGPFRDSLPAAPIAHNSKAPAGAAYLEDLAGRPVDRNDLLHAWLARLDHWCSTLEAPGGELGLVEAYRPRCATLGKGVRVELANAAFEGRATDITDQGHLVVESGTARRTVTAGDVVHLRPASEPF